MPTGRALLVAALLAVLTPARVEAQPAIRRVEVTVDLRSEDRAREALESLAGLLGAGDEPVVFLTLTVLPSNPRSEDRATPRANRIPPHALSFRPARGRARPRLCDNDFGQDGEVGFRTQFLYTHLNLSVRTSSPAVMPFASAGCGYFSESPGLVAFYIRGYYTRVRTMVATAEDVTLWPVRPY